MSCGSSSSYNMPRNRIAAAVTINKIASLLRLKVSPFLSHLNFFLHNNFLHSKAYHHQHQTESSIHFHQYPNTQNTSNHHQHLPQTENPQFQSTPHPSHNQTTNSLQFQQNPALQFNREQIPYDRYYRESRGRMEFDSPTITTLETDEPIGTSQCQGILEKLNGLCKEGHLKEAKQVLGLLEKQCIKLDLHMFFPLIKAFSKPEYLPQAKAVHNHLIRSFGKAGVNVNNKIVEMYCKCGAMSDAYALFEEMTERDLASWATMITGLAKNGLGEEAIDLFTRFKETGMKPDGQLFFRVFYACNVLGDIDEGMLHFESMNKVYGISPSVDHCVSMVDMLASTGYLDEALEFVENMPVEPNVQVWGKLMNLSRVHGDKELGDYCADMVEYLDPSHLTEQAKAGLLPVEPSPLAQDEKKSNKNYLTNLISDGKREIADLKAGDTSHPRTNEMYALLKGLSVQMKEVGYVPETRFVLHDIDQESKEEAILAHSEKLALACALISSPPRSLLHILKNLRVCVDCHNAFKIMSTIVGRDIVMRDLKRFHHFKNAVCSCKDYW